MTTDKMTMGPKFFNEVTGLNIESFADEKMPEYMSMFALAPACSASLTMSRLIGNQHGPHDKATLLLELNRQLEETINDGDMERAQKLLTAQAATLDTLFHSLVAKALDGGPLQKFEAMMKLALKAQSQSRCTLEAISKIKNPPNATFVKQANITQGNQQVNNYGNQTPQTGDATPPRAQETANMPNELLEAQHGERLDFGPETAPSSVNSQMETLAEVDRTKNQRRKIAVKSERISRRSQN